MPLTCCYLVTDGPISSYPASTNMWLQVTEEGAELSQQLANSGFAGPVIDPENEELMQNISSRLQAAVEKLLEALSESTSQVTFLSCWHLLWA